MNKEFIPYELADELKELGFTGGEGRYYIEDLGMCERILWQQAFRWFRDKYDLFPKVHFNSRYDRLPPYYDYTIGDMNHYIILNARNEEFNTYEEAELACLKKLIELVKNK